MTSEEHGGPPESTSCCHLSVEQVGILVGCAHAEVQTALWYDVLRKKVQVRAVV